MILRPVFPEVGQPIDLDAPDARERVVELYRPSDSQWVRLNLIASVSGSAAGSDGTSESLSSATDRLVLKAIRSLADVVVVGAASVRAEGYFVPKDGALAIVSRSGDFSGHHLRGTDNKGSVVILCPHAVADRARATIGIDGAKVVAVPDVDGSLAAEAIIAALRELGYRSIVAEGGPSLATQLLLGGVVDELCLSTSPILNGGDLPILGAKSFSEHPIALQQLLVDDAGFTYARYGLR